jgi:hypothetical protein
MKILEIESQLNETNLEVQLMYLCISLAKEAGYTHVKDNWGYNAYDWYSIDEALVQFKPKNS